MTRQSATVASATAPPRRPAARLAVLAAALVLGGVALAAWARLGAARALAQARDRSSASVARLEELVGAELATAQRRVQGLVLVPAVRGAVETDAATVRDMARAGGFGTPVAGEIIELFQLPAGRPPQRLVRLPEASPPLGFGRAEQARLLAAPSVGPGAAAALVVAVTATIDPLYAHGSLQGAVAVGRRLELTSLAAALSAEGIVAELDGPGGVVPLSTQPWPAGAPLVATSVPLPPSLATSRLTLRAAVRGGHDVALWAGRSLLLAGLAAALLALVEQRRRRQMTSLEDLPTQRQDTRARAATASGAGAAPADNVPRALDGEETAPQKLRSDGNHLVLAWSANMPTPITQLRPQESVPIVLDPRGDRLSSRYRLLRTVGRGAAAEVYLAQSFVPGVTGTVALKLLDGGPSAERDAFLDAARRQRRVHHPNVARVEDVGDDDIAYVAMEYVEGCTLEVLLRDLFARDEPLPLPLALSIVAAICRALDAAHDARDERGVRVPLVHGAVKPGNVLVGRHDTIKLSDFGAPPSPTDRHAPEQYAGKQPDRRSDVYAAGVILHELVTARRIELPAGDSKRWPPLPAPSSIRPGLPRALDAVVARATRFGPRGRQATAGELLAELLRATADAVNLTGTAWLGDWVDRARHSS